MVAKDQTEGEVIKESVRVQIKKSRVLGQTDQELHMKELEREKWEAEGVIQERAIGRAIMSKKGLSSLSNNAENSNEAQMKRYPLDLILNQR